jgi:hypothetical protein
VVAFERLGFESARVGPSFKGHRFKAVLREQLDSFVGNVRLELVGRGSGLFSVQ